MSSVKKYSKYLWLVALVVLVMLHKSISGYVNNTVKDVRRTPVLGQNSISNPQSEFQVSSQLPLVRLETSGSDGGYAEVNDSLFFARRDKEEKVVYVAPVEQSYKVDYRAEIPKHMTLVGTSDRGAFINGTFYRVGEVIEQYGIRDSDGNVVEATLVSISKGKAVVRAGGVKATLRLSS